MTNNPENLPAFPLPVSISPAGDIYDGERGMLLRDYFAAAALQGCLAYSYHCPSQGNYQENATPDDVARKVYEYADAMLRRRSL